MGRDAWKGGSPLMGVMTTLDNYEVVRNLVKADRSFGIPENVEIKREDDRTGSTLDIEVEVGGDLPISLCRFLCDK